MLCRNPFMAGAVAFGCGQCLHCRINRSRQWKWRQVLEAMSHGGSCFVTLTYNESNFPRSGEVEPRDLQLFLKRFRRGIEPQRVRFFGVGEYGSESYRPHYHVNLFGVQWVALADGRSTSEVVDKCWGKGFISVREFNLERAGYVSGYITKFLRDRRDSRLTGKHAEFARMSRRPGLGSDAMRTFADTLWKEEARSGVLSKVKGLPGEFRVEGKKVLLGRFLLSKLRKELGVTDEYAKELADDVSFKRSVELCTVFAAEDGLPSFAAAYLSMAEQALRNQAARAAIFRKKEQL